MWRKEIGDEIQTFVTPMQKDKYMNVLHFLRVAFIFSNLYIFGKKYVQRGYLQKRNKFIHSIHVNIDETISLLEWFKADQNNTDPLYLYCTLLENRITNSSSKAPMLVNINLYTSMEQEVSVMALKTTIFFWTCDERYKQLLTGPRLRMATVYAKSIFQPIMILLLSAIQSTVPLFELYIPTV